MTKTEHYQLNQWEPGDEVKREDFNADNAKVDAAIKAVEDKAEQAQSAAEGAQKTAETSYAVGVYTGNGLTADEGGVFVETGFKPRFVIITQSRISPSNPKTTMMVGEGGVDGTEHYVVFLENGFRVYFLTVYGTSTTPLQMNNSGETYSYAAFR